MSNRASIAVALFTTLALLPCAPVLAQGEIVITQAKANAGGVTPGDTANFPVTLSRPGAYVLGGNLQVPANKNGLHVTSHNVDIDMNGFRLHGGGVANNGVYSIRGESRIHGGVISSFKLDGIFLNGVGTNSWVVEDMQIVNNKRNGISAEFSYYSRFLKNSVLANANHGIACYNHCHIEGNTCRTTERLGFAFTAVRCWETRYFPM